MRLSGTQATIIRVFISSGDDALDHRDFLDALVRDAVNAALMHCDLPVRFDVDRWERSAPHKVVPNGTPNDEFVARAKRANLVVGVLIDRLGSGTREELEAVLAADDVELSIVWCEEREGSPDSEVSRWLFSSIERVVYDRAGRPNTDGPKIALVRLITEALLTVLRRDAPKELMHEQR